MSAFVYSRHSDEKLVPRFPPFVSIFIENETFSMFEFSLRSWSWSHNQYSIKSTTTSIVRTSLFVSNFVYIFSGRIYTDWNFTKTNVLGIVLKLWIMFVFLLNLMSRSCLTAIYVCWNSAWYQCKRINTQPWQQRRVVEFNWECEMSILPCFTLWADIRGGSYRHLNWNTNVICLSVSVWDKENV